MSLPVPTNTTPPAVTTEPACPPPLKRPLPHQFAGRWVKGGEIPSRRTPGVDRTVDRRDVEETGQRAIRDRPVVRPALAPGRPDLVRTRGRKHGYDRMRREAIRRNVHGEHRAD